MDNKEVILTGLRTNSNYHLGNYLGAILPMVQLQKDHLNSVFNMFAPDLHSFSTEIDHGNLYDQTMTNIKVFVAAGLNIESQNLNIYRQSFIPAHSELTVILNNFTYFGELSRMTQFKDKSDQHKSITVGLFDYPVLMASDILLYGAKWIPVGEDQRQHLELARDISIRMNNKFGELFVVPETWDNQLNFAKRLEAPRIRSLKNPSNKMSKSVEDTQGTIQLNDTPEDAADKIKKAETDNLGSINWDWENQPGITNLLLIYMLLKNISKEELLNEWQGRSNYGELKTAVANEVSQFLSNLQSKLDQLNDDEIERKILASEKAMNEVANKVLLNVQKAVGLRK